MNIKESDFCNPVNNVYFDLPGNDLEKTNSVNTLENIIYNLLIKSEMSLDAIYQALGDKYSIEDLSISLVELEMDGKIVKNGSRYFAMK